MPDAASWWGEPGRPGWTPDAWLGTGYPASLAGLVAGGWRLEEPARAPAALPPPGVVPARSPLAWYDSVAVRPGEGWLGFDDALAVLRGTAAAGTRHAHSAFTLENGAHALEEYALTVARGDSLKDAGVDVMSGTHGAESGFEITGRHLWGARVRLTKGRQEITGAFSQRGAAARLEDDEEEATSGQSGTLAWSLRARGARWTVGYERGRDRHESFGGPLAYSDREAQETRVWAEALRARGGRELGARVRWTGAEVSRTWAGAFDRRATSVEAAARAAAPLGGGRIELAVAVGRHDAAKRLEATPSAAFSVRGAQSEVGLSVERMVTPVWGDLAPGVDPFLQRAWVATARAAHADSQGWRARASLRGGRVYSRALADRLPLEDLWLREGLRPELGTYDLVLAEAGLSREGRGLEGGVEGFGLAHRGIALPPGAVRPPRADPAAGFRAWAGAHARFFTGDLHAGLRAIAEGVGAREADLVTGRIELPGFVTLSAEARLEIGDATLVIRARNLEDRTRELPWLDFTTGLPATTGRPDVRFTLVWRLFD